MARIIEADGYLAALKTSLSALASDGHATAPRGRGTREIQHVVLSLRSPRRRFPRIRHRNANVFALFAETLWVLAGRDDLAFIQGYLPRMADYSDDGVRLSGELNQKATTAVPSGWTTNTTCWVRRKGGIC